MTAEAIDEKAKTDAAEQTSSDQTDSDKAEAEAPPREQVSNKVADRFRVEFSKPIKELHIRSAMAYLAVDDKSRSRDVFAWVCEPRAPFRTRPLRALANRPCPNTLGVYDAGVVANPMDGERSLAIIMQRPEGGRLIGNMKDYNNPMSEKDVIEFVLPQLLTGIENLLNRGVVHRNIRPDNIFFADRERQQLLLGDCISCAPGKNQPILFETIERGLASRDGRGFGGHSDDMYALGILLLTLIMGRDPKMGRDDATLIQHKIAQGSFVALAGDARMSPGVTSLLRGLLADDPEDRWSADMVRGWRDGRTIKTRRALPDKRADSAINFLGTDFVNPRWLAQALGRFPEDAANFCRSGKLETWVRRNLEESKVADELSFVIGQVGESAAARTVGDPLMITQVCYILDPYGPLRYRRLTFMHDGLGPIFAAAMIGNKGDELTALRTLIVRGILLKWLDMKNVLMIKNVTGAEIFQKIGKLLEVTELGGGMERVLYELNPSIPCISPNIIDAHALSVRELLEALDDALAKKEDMVVVDRHVAAFICAKSAKIEDQFNLWTRIDPDGVGPELGILAMLAHAQRESVTGPLKIISAWTARTMGDKVINGYHAKSRRVEIQGKLKRVASKGDLIALLELLGSQTTRQTDKDEYAKAVNQYSTMEREIQALEMDDRTRSALAVRVGHRIAFTVAYGLLFLSMAWSIFGVF